CNSSFSLPLYLVCLGALTTDAIALTADAGVIAACYTPEGAWAWGTGACQTAVAAFLAGLATIPAACQYCAYHTCSYDPTALNYVYGYQNAASGNACPPQG
ncbi:MAG TPA: hypothetical protein VGI63_10485, partial [Verrucomicrobiae bacterium]